jgi:hypothetical protein
MNNQKPNAAQVWRELEDVVVPALRLSPTDRVVYAHLLRHTVLEGKTRLRFSIYWLARGTNLSTGSVRPAVRRLAMRGALRVVDRSKSGHLVEVRFSPWHCTMGSTGRSLSAARASTARRRPTRSLLLSRCSRYNCRRKSFAAISPFRALHSIQQDTRLR